MKGATSPGSRDVHETPQASRAVWKTPRVFHAHQNGEAVLGTAHQNAKRSEDDRGFLASFAVAEQVFTLRYISEPPLTETTMTRSRIRWVPVNINEALVREQRQRLQGEYGEVPVEEGTVEVPAEEFPAYVENAREGYVGSAYAWVVRRPEQAGERSETYAGDEETRERALMILPRGESEWGVPGGGLEGDESFEQAARREVREEAGVDCEITGLWHIEHLEWRSEDPDDERVTHTLHVFFDADYTGGQIATQEAEVNGAAWFAEPPARLDEKAALRADTNF